jgi:hypothetical protein
VDLYRLHRLYCQSRPLNLSLHLHLLDLLDLGCLLDLEDLLALLDQLDLVDQLARLMDLLVLVLL